MLNFAKLTHLSIRFCKSNACLLKNIYGFGSYTLINLVN